MHRFSKKMKAEQRQSFEFDLNWVSWHSTSSKKPIRMKTYCVVDSCQNDYINDRNRQLQKFKDSFRFGSERGLLSSLEKLFIIFFLILGPQILVIWGIFNVQCIYETLFKTLYISTRNPVKEFDLATSISPICLTDCSWREHPLWY